MALMAQVVRNPSLYEGDIVGVSILVLIVGLISATRYLWGPILKGSIFTKAGWEYWGSWRHKKWVRVFGTAGWVAILVAIGGLIFLSAAGYLDG